MTEKAAGGKEKVSSQELFTSVCLEQLSEWITFTDAEDTEEECFCEVNGGHNFRHVKIVCGVFKRSLTVGS